jgi:hypothetical protein
MLRRAAARPAGQRLPIIGALVISWILMEPQQVGTLVPILLHFIGVVVVCLVAIVTLMRPAPATAGVRLPSTRARTSQ